MNKVFKRSISVVLALMILLLAVPMASAVDMPRGNTVSYELEEEFIDSHGISGNVKVKVTLENCIGELSASDAGIGSEILNAAGWSWWYRDDYNSARENPIYVLKSGSKVKFTITASDPQAYYNFCYNRQQFDGYTFDDCGGGCVYRYDPDYGWDTSPLFVTPNGDGTANMSGGTYATAKAVKSGSNSYAYSAEEGLFTFCFTAKEKGDYMDNVDGVGKYVLGTFLFVGERQASELETIGTMNFHSFYEEGQYVYDYLFPGIDNIFELDLRPISIHFDDDFYESDYGHCNSVTFRNNTNEPVKGAFSLLLYSDRLKCDACSGKKSATVHSETPRALIYSIDLDLEPGEKTSFNFYFNSAWNMATTKYILVEYDDAAERSQYLNSSYLSNDLAFAENNGYVKYLRVLDKAYLEAFPYNIEFNTLTHR